MSLPAASHLLWSKSISFAAFGHVSLLAVQAPRHAAIDVINTDKCKGCPCRSFVQAIFKFVSSLHALVTGHTADSARSQQTAESAGSLDCAALAGRHSFLQILALLLQLDTPAVLKAEEAATGAFLLEPYLSILQLPYALQIAVQIGLVIRIYVLNHDRQLHKCICR